MSQTSRLPRVRASEFVGRGWLNTGGADLTLIDLRGTFVLVDFWTFCCINCLHVLDELRELEEEFAEELVMVGVHSPKFTHEADPNALAAAVERYGVAHPVLNDADMTTWKAYTARAWPTLVLIDPEGYVVAHVAGEGHAPGLTALLRELIAEHDARGTIRRGDGPYVPPEPPSTVLRFPAKALALPHGNLLVADAGHHSLAELAPDGETFVRRIGSGQRGRTDGGPDEASFNEPNGLCLVPPELGLDYDVLVADTVNHLLRGVRLADGLVRTVAGSGRPYRVGAPDNRKPSDELTEAFWQNLSSPWDVAWVPQLDGFLVAMAGTHTLWLFDGEQRYIRHYGGTMNEGLVDGELEHAWFAQPSGLAMAEGGLVWLADAETSALRLVDIARGQVSTAVGEGLYEFGHRDGPADSARLQHPLGGCVLGDGSVAVADTYNGAVRRYDPVTREVTTLARDLAEPSGLVLTGEHLLVVESAGHRLVRISIDEAFTHDGGAHQVGRPVAEVGAEVALRVLFTPAPGTKLDDRYGPATQLSVSATPPSLLRWGHGEDAPLNRELHFAHGEGVLHVSARAAACDADPDVEFSACHLAQQEWGIPVRVVDGGDTEVALALVTTI